MSVIDSITSKLSAKKTKPENLEEIHAILSQISHDLKGNLVAIRASAGSIKQYVSSLETGGTLDNIERAISGIDKKVTYSLVLLEMVKTIAQSIDTSTLLEENFSITDCIKAAIQTYPFASSKYATTIILSTPITDFSVKGNKHLIIHVFYCLIRNALRSIYNSGSGKAFISLEEDDGIPKVHFKFTEDIKTNHTLDKGDLFSVGTPLNPGNGFRFISSVMKNVNGKAIFLQESENAFTISLLFCSK